jgi:hypothetical protein
VFSCFHVEYILKQKSSIISHDNTLSGDKVAGDNDFGFVPRCFRTRQTRKYGALGVAPVARQVGKVGPAAAAAVVGLASAGHDVAVVRFYVMKVAGGSIPRKRVIHQGMSYSILNNVFEFNIEMEWEEKTEVNKSNISQTLVKKVMSVPIVHAGTPQKYMDAWNQSCDLQRQRYKNLQCYEYVAQCVLKTKHLLPNLKKTL